MPSKRGNSKKKVLHKFLPRRRRAVDFQYCQTPSPLAAGCSKRQWPSLCSREIYFWNHIFLNNLLCTPKKRLAVFPCQTGMSHPNSPWAVIIKSFLPRKSLFSDIPNGDGKAASIFLQCTCIWAAFRNCIKYLFLCLRI
jgi:hypothetical protein